jgi:hypothetical protein
MIGRAEVDPKGGDRREGYATFRRRFSDFQPDRRCLVNSRDIIFARDFFVVQPGASLYSQQLHHPGPDRSTSSTSLRMPNAVSFSEFSDAEYLPDQQRRFAERSQCAVMTSPGLG